MKYIKAIFEPIKYAKKNFLLYSIFVIFDGFQSVFIVVIIAYIITALETNNLENLYFWIWIFIFIGVLKLFHSLFADSIHSNMYNDIAIWLTKKYFFLIQWRTKSVK